MEHRAASLRQLSLLFLIGSPILIRHCCCTHFKWFYRFLIVILLRQINLLFLYFIDNPVKMWLSNKWQCENVAHIRSMRQRKQEQTDTQTYTGSRWTETVRCNLCLVTRYDRQVPFAPQWINADYYNTSVQRSNFVSTVTNTTRRPLTHWHNATVAAADGQVLSDAATNVKNNLKDFKILSIYLTCPPPP